MKKLIALVLAFVMVLAMTACGSSAPAAEAPKADAPAAEAPKAEADTYKIGFSVSALQTEFCMKIAEEFELAVKEAGDAELTILSADGDNNMQVTNIENFITMGMDAICVYPSDAEVLSDVMKKAREAGIYVVILDQMPSDTESFDVGISCSMRDLGVNVCEMVDAWVEETFPDAADNTVKCGVLGVWATEQFGERCTVFNEINSYNSKCTVVDCYDTGIANFATESANNADMMIQKTPDINVIMCFTDTMALLAQETIDKNKDLLGIDPSKIGIFTVDHSTNSFDMLEKSKNDESCIRGIVTTNLNVGRLFYEAATKQFDTSALENGKILYQDIHQISTENMEDYREYILGG